MSSIAIHDHRCDVLPRISVCSNDATRYGCENRTNAFSSSNSTMLIHLSVRSSSPSSHHPCSSLTNVSDCDTLSMPRICPESFPDAQTRRPSLIQAPGPYRLNQPSSDTSCSNNMIPSTSHLSEPRRPIQLFIKSIRNTTISIHIDSTSAISDLKHLIYAYDGIPPCYLRLMHRGRELPDDALLSGLDVDGATITCLLRVVGGNPYNNIPVYWWFGFSRSYEDGRAGEEGRTCHVLSEIEFVGEHPENWYSDLPLCDWSGLDLSCGMLL